MDDKSRLRFTLRGLLAVVVAVAMVAGLVRAWPYVPKDRIHCLSDGMTEAQVVKVMGEPSSRLASGSGGYYLTWPVWPWRVAVVELSSDGHIVWSNVE